MMKQVSKILLKFLLAIISLFLLYGFAAILLSAFGTNRADSGNNSQTIFLTTNGVHLDIIIAKEDLDENLLIGLAHSSHENYFAFGWGDEDFYLNTPNWSDLSFKTAFKAVFLKGQSLVHLTRYQQPQADWVAVSLSPEELHRVNQLLFESFQTDSLGNKMLLVGKGYTYYDDFYKAKGSYSLFKTCNTWANAIFKKSGLKACLWTPFDFPLLRKHQVKDQKQ